MPRHYDRVQILAAAGKAQTRGRLRTATRLLRRVLQFEPGNAELHFRVATLLARTRRPFEAWESFQCAAASFERDKQDDGAAAVYAEATRRLPECLAAWRGRARLERQRGKEDAAVKLLLEARRHFRGRGKRAEAIALLREARGMAPWEPDLVTDLARLLHRSDQVAEAEWLLESLATRVAGHALFAVRTAQCRLEPSLAHVWQWLRAAWSALRDPRGALRPARKRPPRTQAYRA